MSRDDDAFEMYQQAKVTAYKQVEKSKALRPAPPAEPIIPPPSACKVKACPGCGGTISKQALSCPHCGWHRLYFHWLVLTLAAFWSLIVSVFVMIAVYIKGL